MKFCLVIAACCLLFVSCQKKKPEADASRQPLIEVEGQFLYEDELASVIQPGLSPEDSAALADAYIRNWATNVLLYENAKRNVANEVEINQMVEEYRKSLIIHYYQQNLVAQRLGDVSDDEVAAYYEVNADRFPLNENVLRGVFLKVPNGAPKIDKVRTAIRKLDDDKDIQRLEEYSVQHAASYDYFVDTWILMNDLAKKMPLEGIDQRALLANNSYYEVADSTYTYMLNITDRRLIGSPAPLEFVQERIRTLLNNQRRQEYIKQLEQSLYDDAAASGVITFYSPVFNNKNLIDDETKN